MELFQLESIFATKREKKYKVFGPDDTDALKLLKKYLHIEFISGDKKGFKISKIELLIIWVLNYLM